MDFTTITVSAAGPLGRLTLNRPEKRNPLSSTTLREIAGAARWFDERHEVKVVIVAGEGRSFSAGADLAGFESPAEPGLSSRDGAELGRTMADAVEAMTAITIARLHGHCVGGALVLATACDLRVAAADTYFSIPEVDLGIPLTWGGIPRLVREIGPARTKELVMTCRPFSAAEGHAAGLLNRVVDAGDLDREIDDLAAILVTKSALTLRATKRHVDAITAGMVGLDRTWADADGFVAALADPESRAAAGAYLARVRKKRG